MYRDLLYSITGLIAGLLLGYIFVIYTPLLPFEREVISYSLPKGIFPQKQVIGFLPYWLVEKADKSYPKSISTLTYFGLTVDTDGTILKKLNKRELELGWNALNSGKMDNSFAAAKNNKQKLSLLVFSGDQDKIDQLATDPIAHAQNLIRDVSPIMQQYGFTDLNLDIEKIEDASTEARVNFTQFTKEVKRQLDQQKLGTLTVDITASSPVKSNLIDVAEVSKIADYLVLMGYDFHHPGSFVTGPVAPVSGAQTVAEFDLNVALQQALKVIPKEKLILGIPSYGYEWETISNFPRAAVIPGSGVVASSQRVDTVLQNCTNCLTKTDEEAQENYTIYEDLETKTYHQIFYPTGKSTQAKIDLVRNYKIGGLAVWALGYEDSRVMKPLDNYLNTIY